MPVPVQDLDMSSAEYYASWMYYLSLLGLKNHYLSDRYYSIAGYGGTLIPS